MNSQVVDQPGQNSLHCETKIVPNQVDATTGKVAPRDHNTIIRVSLFTMATLLVTAVVTYLGRILEPLAFAIFLFFVIEPVAGWLTRLQVPRWLSYSGLLIVVIVVYFTLAQVTTSNIAAFSKPEQQKEYVNRAAEITERLSPGMGDNVRNWAGNASTYISDEAPARIIDITEFGLMMFFYLTFVILNSHRLSDRVRRAYPDSADHVLAVGDRISSGIRRYIGVKTLVSLGMGLTAAAVLAPFGVRYWPLWAFLFFILNYITYIGSIAACVPPIVLAFLDLSPLSASLVSALVILMRIFWIDFVEIKLSGRELNIDPILVLLALAYWGWFWGLPGLVLAVPMLTGIKVILESVEATRPWAILMSEK